MQQKQPSFVTREINMFMSVMSLDIYGLMESKTFVVLVLLV
jgi:hypothetical protein